MKKVLLETVVTKESYAGREEPKKFSKMKPFVY
jgi:hypothetical protein